MEKRNFIQTKENFVVGWTKKGEGFQWFIHHKKIKDGETFFANVGELEKKLGELMEQLKGE